MLVRKIGGDSLSNSAQTVISLFFKNLFEAPVDPLITLDMTIDKADFHRLLPGAVVDRDYRVEGDRIIQGDGRQGWTLELKPLEPLPLGHLSMPRLRVEVHLRGHSSEAVAAFLARFHRGFQRGGG